MLTVDKIISLFRVVQWALKKVSEREQEKARKNYLRVLQLQREVRDQEAERAAHLAEAERAQKGMEYNGHSIRYLKGI